jgi:hypothetical protein
MTIAKEQTIIAAINWDKQDFSFLSRTVAIIAELHSKYEASTQDINIHYIPIQQQQQSLLAESKLG